MARFSPILPDLVPFEVIGQVCGTGFAIVETVVEFFAERAGEAGDFGFVSIHPRHFRGKGGIG